jgi:hypothetical protein
MTTADDPRGCATITANNPLSQATIFSRWAAPDMATSTNTPIGKTSKLYSFPLLSLFHTTARYSHLSIGAPRWCSTRYASHNLPPLQIQFCQMRASKLRQQTRDIWLGRRRKLLDSQSHTINLFVMTRLVVDCRIPRAALQRGRKIAS